MTRMTFDVQVNHAALPNCLKVHTLSKVAMSIFHWLPMKTQEEFELVLEAFVSLARVTILEFPQKHHGTQMNWQNILKWYGERDSAQEVSIIEGSMMDTSGALGSAIWDDTYLFLKLQNVLCADN